MIVPHLGPRRGHRRHPPGLFEKLLRRILRLEESRAKFRLGVPLLRHVLRRRESLGLQYLVLSLDSITRRVTHLPKRALLFREVPVVAF